MVCQNKIVRKQSSKSILPKIISKILIMIHTSVVFSIKLIFLVKKVITQYVDFTFTVYHLTVK